MLGHIHWQDHRSMFGGKVGAFIAAFEFFSDMYVK